MLNLLETIKKIPFFHNLDDKQYQLLADISIIESYNLSTILYYERTKSNRLYFLVNGLAKAYKIDKYENEIFLFYIYTHNIISDIDTIDDTLLLSYCNISFLEDSEVLSIDYDLFSKYFLNTNILIKEFLKETISRDKQLKSLIDREFVFDAVAKVAMMLDTDLDMFNKLKKQNIALILHIQPSTLSRVLNRLKKDGIIQIIHGKVSIIDKTNLKTIYEVL
jgi:CRP/FNR family transcriptional regulator